MRGGRPIVSDAPSLACVGGRVGPTEHVHAAFRTLCRLVAGVKVASAASRFCTSVRCYEKSSMKCVPRAGC